MTDYRKRLEAVAVDLARYDTDCTLARSYARQIVADLSKLLSEGERMRKALVRLRDCDWVITPLDRMDAVRDIARQALGDPEQ